MLKDLGLRFRSKGGLDYGFENYRFDTIFTILYVLEIRNLFLILKLKYCDLYLYKDRKKRTKEQQKKVILEGYSNYFSMRKIEMKNIKYKIF